MHASSTPPAPATRSTPDFSPRGCAVAIFTQRFGARIRERGKRWWAPSTEESVGAWEARSDTLFWIRASGLRREARQHVGGPRSDALFWIRASGLRREARQRVGVGPHAIRI